MGAKLLQLCPTPCDPMDCNPPGSSVHGILQARILEWVAMPSSRESSQPRDGPISYVSYIGRWVLYHECHHNVIFIWASLVAQKVKNLPAMQETQVQSLGWEDPLEKRMDTHSSFLA